MRETDDCVSSEPRAVAQTPHREDSERIVHLSPAEHAARGRAARKDVPRSSHCDWSSFKGRPSPVDLLEEQAAARVPELVPIRYGRMLVSPFTFYRGGAYVMASDLSHTPVSGLSVQLCGDAHLSNFGGFASPERRMVFDINDFDETLPGPWEFDAKRLAASFEIAGRDLGVLHEAATPGGHRGRRVRIARRCLPLPQWGTWRCGTRVLTPRSSYLS